jgi:hypothetical protein
VEERLGSGCLEHRHGNGRVILILIIIEICERVLGPKGDEMTGSWRKLHNEELHNFYSSPSIIRMMKSRRMRWAGHVGRMGEECV